MHPISIVCTQKSVNMLPVLFINIETITLTYHRMQENNRKREGGAVWLLND